jgi:hypothetical protein
MSKPAIHDGDQMALVRLQGVARFQHGDVIRAGVLPVRPARQYFAAKGWAAKASPDDWDDASSSAQHLSQFLRRPHLDTKIHREVQVGHGRRCHCVS